MIGLCQIPLIWDDFSASVLLCARHLSHVSAHCFPAALPELKHNIPQSCIYIGFELQFVFLQDQFGNIF